MYKIELFPDDNFIILTLSGDLTSSDINGFMQETADLLVQLKKPAFGIVTDIRKLKTVSEEALPLLIESMRFFKEKGLKVIARVFENPQSPIISQWQHANIKAGYTSTTYFAQLDKAVTHVKEKMKDYIQ